MPEFILNPPEVESTPPILYPRGPNEKDWANKSIRARVDRWFWVYEKGWFINWDQDRWPFLTIVVHHSETKSDATPDEIAQIHKNNLWIPCYQNPNDNDPYVFGLEPHSGHCINGRETFCCYHHLIYPDGKITTELQALTKINDVWFIDMVGWHAGDWAINNQSIAICLIGDYTYADPSETQVKALIGLINYYKMFNPNVAVVPHKKVSRRTICPGNHWFGWEPSIPWTMDMSSLI
ncbi:MAG: peptidoglycan recognition family protein [Candidatus Pacebacteria bacterium]|nr:peptidoglycan recognition family protein [Candidatus Paceibacterota bacterium]